MTEIYFVWIRDSFWSIALEHAGSRRQSGWKLGSQPARIDSSRSSMHAWVRVRLDLSERRFCKTTQGVGSKLPYGAWEIQLRLVLYHNIFYSSMERPSGVPSYHRRLGWLTGAVVCGSVVAGVRDKRFCAVIGGCGDRPERAAVPPSRDRACCAAPCLFKCLAGWYLGVVILTPPAP